MTDMDMPLPTLPSMPPELMAYIDRFDGAEYGLVMIAIQRFAAAAAAKERERAFQWCDFYAHAIDHGGNRYVRSNDALTAAHAVKSGTPAAAIRATPAEPPCKP